MPSTKVNGAAAADATKKKKSSSKDKDAKVKNKLAKSSAKDKKDKKASRTKAKTPEHEPTAPSTPSTSPPPASTPTLPLDPDAIQLFRRYDVHRTGFLARRDFLRLLRDYNERPPPSTQYHRRHWPTTTPLSLTDSHGIPLGYERSEKNSEFEAGQLFERYDKDHAGTLSLDKFLVFFHDFHAQLRAFVDDLSYASPAVFVPGTADHDEPSRTQPRERIAAMERTPEEDGAVNVSAPSADTTTSKPLRDTYQQLLWELRKICKDELHAQRTLVVDAMKQVQDHMNTRTSTTSTTTHGEDRLGYHRFRWEENQLADEYDALESDLERIDEILRLARRHVRRGWDVSTEEMQDLVKRGPVVLSEARELAMKSYARVGHQAKTEEMEEMERARTTKAAMVVPVPASAIGSESVDELKRALLIKDQMIYELLQERTVLRREKAHAETDLQELTHVSTEEMKKWARLTDDMQAEIAFLRNELLDR